MRRSPLQKPDPKLDLVLERVVDVPRELVWEAWTQPEHVKAWFTPRPWRTIECEIDLRPGGIFRTVMQGPNDSAEVNNVACYLEILPNERLVWTDTLLPGWRPADGARFGMTVVIALESLGDQTRYCFACCVVLHLFSETLLHAIFIRRIWRSTRPRTGSRRTAWAP